MMLLEAIYYFLPAYIANMVPPLFQWLPLLDTPLDFNKKFRGRRIFGSHKTIRGILLGSVFGILTIYVQKLLYNNQFFNSISIINYSEQVLWLGFLLGFGALFGDSVESFFKRRVNIAQGKPWFPFDQLDFVFGAFIFSFLIFIPSVKTLLIIIIITPIIHMSFHYAGYLFGINKDKI
ncbi:hypothetical protein CMO90_03435 [Candidatus Woesearchaeota archaeon]|nr:hypothetical protein [Candidatus Woesearchaeota archaeon]|tara:strand:- start:2492 stop:3025 length:534 start_codon:yes stop_codon:yes gene_type:complete